MSVQALGLKAYTTALSNFHKAEQTIKGASAAKTEKADPFADTLKHSLTKVNEVQMQKNAMIESFASGETQNVHELMISLQKAGLAMSMTAAMRNKVLEAYRELARMQF